MESRGSLFATAADYEKSGNTGDESGSKPCRNAFGVCLCLSGLLQHFGLSDWKVCPEPGEKKALHKDGPFEGAC